MHFLFVLSWYLDMPHLGQWKNIQTLVTHTSMNYIIIKAHLVFNTLCTLSCLRTHYFGHPNNTYTMCCLYHHQHKHELERLSVEVSYSEIACSC